MSELDLARALLKHNYPIVLPAHYAPFDKPSPEGKMVVVGVKAQKTSATKAVLWVRFTSPPSYVGHQIQLYPKSLEPKNGPAKGADFSILSALASNHPHATTLRHLGIHEQTSSQMTTAMMAVLLQYRAGTPFSASDLDDGTGSSLKQQTSEQNPMLLDVLAGEEGHVVDDSDPDAPAGYSRSAQDPKHRGAMLHHPMRKEFCKAENTEMEGLWGKKVLEKVKRSSLSRQDKVFGSRFHYKIKRKNGKFDKCKVCLVVQGQHMRKKNVDGIGDYEDSFSPVPHASGFRTILALATMWNMMTDHVDISQAFVQGELLPALKAHGSPRFEGYRIINGVKLLSGLLVCLTDMTHRTLALRNKPCGPRWQEKRRIFFSH